MSIENIVISIIKTAAYCIFIKVVIGIAVLIAIFIKIVFGIDIGHSIMISCVLILTVYIIYKTVKYVKREKIENQTIWDKMGISEEMRFTLQRYFLAGFLPIFYMFLLIRFDVKKGTVLMAVFIAVLICLNYKLHAKLYNFIASKIKSAKKEKYAYALRKYADTVCKNCGALISKKDRVCFNCGAKADKKSKTPIIIAILIIAAVVCMRFV
ncbi:MAG: zinc ribbon domain-containing protein [Campylobacteraceae bacterium]|jgi:hypothetical protein|nr:zinc ribbon domain-containing protein [Campylobacteraceae bacterium]